MSEYVNTMTTAFSYCWNMKSGAWLAVYVVSSLIPDDGRRSRDRNVVFKGTVTAKEN